MHRTITALFDSRDDADRAQRRLMDAGVSDVSITAQGMGYDTTATSGATSYDSSATATSDPVRDVTEGDYGDDHDRSRSHGGGLWASIKNLFSDEDRPTYEEGLRRGHFLLTARPSDDRLDDACRILEDSDAIDVDQRSSEWRAGGWTGERSTDDRMQGIVGDDTLHGTHGDDQVRRDAVGDRLTGGTEERIPIVEEQLQVGKREVGRGGVRVRSYVVETPVQEQVSLREEHVDIERRPVDQPVSAADDLFRERTIDVETTAEEVVVAKEARVREELVVRKDVDTHTETISDTVRRTEVDVDDTRGSTLSGETRSFAGSDTSDDLIPGETEDERRRRLALRGDDSTTTTPSV